MEDRAALEEMTPKLKYEDIKIENKKEEEEMKQREKKEYLWFFKNSQKREKYIL